MEDTTDNLEMGPGALASWISSKVEQWQDNIRANYYQKWNEYERLWRGVWKAEDKTRESERSKLIAPALQQAVESNVAEIEEATFGRGVWFDIEDDDAQPGDTEILKNKLAEEFKRNKIRKDISECLINAAVWGTGIAEIVVDEVLDIQPATEPVMDGALRAIGTMEGTRTVVKLNPVLPKNFHIDPHATTIEDAFGCAIEEFVSSHTVKRLQEDGTYEDFQLSAAPSDWDLETTINDTIYDSDKVKLTKYFGFIPSEYLPEDEREDSEYTEAVVIIANDRDILKMTANPYMMKDRPVIAFQWDVVPREFWGRGVCEKGYNSQKALDAEIRARIDALALTVHPMIGLDATKVPRGTNFQVRPGRSVLFNGRPSEAAEPFNFGVVDKITFAQAAELQKMVQQSTGAVDSTAMPIAAASGEGTAAGISMSIGAVIKRHKRTLINFQETFLIPFVEKAAWRYMQFDPEDIPVGDYSFIVSSSLGIMAREYEVGQLVQLLQTTSPESPIYGPLIESIVDNMNLSNREQLLQMLRQAAQPSPQQVQAMQAEEQRKQQAHMAQLRLIESQSAENEAQARKYATDAELAPMEIKTKLVDAIVEHLPKEDPQLEFENRLRLAEVLIKKTENSDGKFRRNGTTVPTSIRPNQRQI